MTENSIKGNFLEGITGIVLAGGKSSRFGSNKALALFNGMPLIERATFALGRVFKNLMIITNTPLEYSYLKIPLYQDIIKGMGPVGGLYTGLDALDDDWAFFCACDMPFINEDLVRYIAGLKEGYDAVVPKVDWKIEPLHALYSKRCLQAMKDLIIKKEFQTIKAFNSISVRFVGEEEIKQFDPELKTFLNVNRQDELERIIKLA
ncbi:MAG: molybdenum cofactor guanylyltransferase [Desulfatiglans sp.]|jgi:molybdopterin-guanine dinucleotide biosynthesis protein A|nr:molybdenum cofactor guanylyltransferase [Desulfatiglans sp.]